MNEICYQFSVLIYFPAHSPQLKAQPPPDYDDITFLLYLK